MCVTHLHLFTHADTAHMCFDTINCTSSLSPFLFQRQEAMKRAVDVREGQQCSAHTLPDCVVLTEGAPVVWNWAVSLGGVRARTQAIDPRLASIGGPCLILHLLRQLHLETLFISSAPELQVLLTKAMGFKSAEPDQEGLCVWDFFW